MTEEDRLRRELRRKERELRQLSREAASRESKPEKEKEISSGAVASSSSRSRRRKHVPVDVVDKLDVTGLYGVGGCEYYSLL
jgi:hypothetical protein